MADMDLGRVTPIYKGDYSDLTSYEFNDIVRFEGSLYWHTAKLVTVGLPPTNTDVWTLSIEPVEIADVPPTDGTYVLKAIVLNGVTTYAWESADGDLFMVVHQD